MNFNILIVDEQENYSSNDQKSLYTLKDTCVFFENNFESISSLLKKEEFNLIILNPQTLSVELLCKSFRHKQYDDSTLPIFILGEYQHMPRISNIFIFDFVNISISKMLFFNKINFCHALYQKELGHKVRMKELLYVDNLTKLPNRAKLINDIRDDTLGISALAVIDIKSFKDINDFYGYRVGDSILKKVMVSFTQKMKDIKDKVLLYKFAGDVYCLANISLDKKEFQKKVIDILEAIDHENFIEDEHEIDIRLMAGITFSKENNKLITANIALQEAKKNNIEYVVFYDELDNFKEYQNNMLWTKKLKRAMDEDNIILYYQPLINNKTMKVDKYECLVRMRDGGQIIAPYFFLGVSKKANQYKNITKIVIEKAFKEFEKLPFDFSVNVSYDDIEDKKFLDFIKIKLEKYNVAKKVVWEILEDEGVKSYDVLFDFIKEVKALGCKVAIDDFGSGYSNFEHLLKMDVDYLKIDASLIKNVATDENSYKVVKTIIEFANSLNLKTIAEYVENEEIFNITKELGSDYSQGYYFSPPISETLYESF